MTEDIPPLSERIPDWDPETMQIHTCRDCGRHEPVSQRFARGNQGAYCHACAGLLEYDDAADRRARAFGFKPGA